MGSEDDRYNKDRDWLDGGHGGSKLPERPTTPDEKSFGLVIEQLANNLGMTVEEYQKKIVDKKTATPEDNQPE